MARREIDDEKRSYSGVFLLVVGLLLVGSVWAVWDDYVTRRPWKKYQASFYALAYNKTRNELAQEDQRLQADSAYHEAQAKLTAAQKEFSDGTTGKRLAELLLRGSKLCLRFLIGRIRLQTLIFLRE